jgi:hypothetical protein
MTSVPFVCPILLRLWFNHAAMFVFVEIVLNELALDNIVRFAGILLKGLMWSTCHKNHGLLQFLHTVGTLSRSLSQGTCH